MACDNHSRCSSPCAAAWIRILSDSTKPHCTTQPIVTSITDSNRASTKQQLENCLDSLGRPQGRAHTHRVQCEPEGPSRCSAQYTGRTVSQCTGQRLRFMPNQCASVSQQHIQTTSVLVEVPALLNEARHSQIHFTAWRMISTDFWQRQCQCFCYSC